MNQNIQGERMDVENPDLSSISPAFLKLALAQADLRPGHALAKLAPGKQDGREVIEQPLKAGLWGSRTRHLRGRSLRKSRLTKTKKNRKGEGDAGSELTPYNKPKQTCKSSNKRVRICHVFPVALRPRSCSCVTQLGVDIRFMLVWVRRII